MSTIKDKRTMPLRKGPKQYFKHQYKSRSLVTCGMLLIKHTLMTIVTRQETWKELSVYLDEMLHSIFFLGYIHNEHITPADFMTPKFSPIFSEIFPEPIKKYRSHLPTRTPFSILLSMMEKLYVTEERITEELQHLLKKLNFPNPLHKAGDKTQNYYRLEATVICVCYSESEQQKHYGASLSCRGEEAKRIFIDLSCLKTWHKYISHTVMSFNPDPASGDAITLPESVKCQAYSRDWVENVYRERQPCLNCKNLFNLPNADENKVHHPYGNCAETESLSKLLFSSQFIQDTTRISIHMEENLENLRASTRSRLVETLTKVNVQADEQNIHFYDPPSGHQIPDIQRALRAHS